ncbi:unnamed protein product [Paramecium sonneborni]|uniref:Transmembrane protein n=1 Tax=Paramecium sonneborni TaxID=65129 RepID=A0A8S1PHL5_9CILI|nr:unnamed protein product [Paramecium sonneborni]
MLYLLYFRKSQNEIIGQKQNKVVPAAEQSHIQLQNSQSIEQGLKKNFRDQINLHGIQSVQTFNQSDLKSQLQSGKTSSNVFSSKYQILKVNPNIQKIDISQRKKKLQSTPTMQEVPDTVRVQDANLLTIAETDEKRTEFLHSRTIFKLINRLLVLQGFQGCMLFSNFHFALASLFSLIAIWIIRFIQTTNFYFDILQLILFISFDITSLFFFNPNEIWTYTYLFLLGIEIILELIILNTQKKKNFENLQIIAQDHA